MARTYQLLASAVINKARRVTNDEDSAGYRTDDAEFIGWLNDALNSMLIVVPNLFTVTGTHTCVAGFHQVLANARASELIDVIGVPVGDLDTLAQFSPGWQSGTAGAIKNWMRSAGDKLGFFCCPPAADAQALTISFIQSPAPLTAITDLIQVPESYEPALVAYLIALASAKDDESVDANRMQQFQSTFVGMVQGVQG